MCVLEIGYYVDKYTHFDGKIFRMFKSCFIFAYMDKYRYIYTVIAAYMDARYRMKVNAVLTYYQDAFARYMTTLGVAAFDLAKEGKTWIITEFHSEFLPADTLWYEQLEVEMWISEFSPLRVYSDFIVRKVATSEVVAKGYACWGVLNIASRTPELTDFLVGRIPVIPDFALSEGHRKVRFPKGDVPVAEVEHTVNLSDLDFNGHVGNRSYLDIAMLTATDSFLASHRIECLGIKWQHETMEGDCLRCGLSAVSDRPGEYVHVLRRKDGVEAATIYSRWQECGLPRDISEILRR